MRTLAKILFLAITATSVAGCASSNDLASDTTVAATATVTGVEENPYGGFPVDPPAPDEVVLTVTVGGVDRNYTLEQLAQLGATTVTLYEPFIQVDATFTGVELSVLFEESAISGEDSVNTIALNEYAYANTAATFTGTGAILAYKQNGMPIAMDRGGPIRIVIPNDKPLSTFLDIWNWSLRSLVVN